MASLFLSRPLVPVHHRQVPGRDRLSHLCCVRPDSPDGAHHAQQPCDRLSVFSIPEISDVLNITLFDARDAMDACSGLSGVAAKSCYASFGCSQERVQKFYPIVAALETSLCAEEDEKDSDEDDYIDEKVNSWHLPQPLDEITAMWADAADAIVRTHNASAREGV